MERGRDDHGTGRAIGAQEPCYRALDGRSMPLVSDPSPLGGGSGPVAAAVALDLPDTVERPFEATRTEDKRLAGALIDMTAVAAEQAPAREWAA